MINAGENVGQTSVSCVAGRFFTTEPPYPEFEDNFWMLIVGDNGRDRDNLLFLTVVDFSGLIETTVSFKYIVYACREIFSLEIQTEFTGHHFLVQRWQLLFTVSVLKRDQNYWAWCLLFYVSKIVVLLLWPRGFKLFQSWKFVSRDSLNDCLLGLWLSFTSKQVTWYPMVGRSVFKWSSPEELEIISLF